MAQIIKLSTTRTSKVRGRNGTKFPQLYRGVGYSWDTPDEGYIVNTLTPTDEPSTPFYTLQMGYDGGRANVQWTPIDRLLPEIDSGWVIVRKHKSRDALDGYLDGIDDAISHEKDPCVKSVYETNLGLFTVQHRPAKPGLTDLLLVYSYSVQEPVMNTWVPEYVVIDRDGNVHDGDILFPENPADQAIVDMLNGKK